MILWMAGIKINRGLEQLMIKAYNIICETWWSSVMHELHGFSGTVLLVFIDDVTEDRSSRINSEVYDTVCPDSVKRSKVYWAVLHSANGR